MASISLSRFTLGFSGLNYPPTQKASNGLKMFSHVFPKPSRRSLDLILCKASTTQQSTARRKNNHHPNLWEDDFINSLPKAYNAPCYVERAEKLIREVKEMFNGMSTHNSSAQERLSMVDNVERLGIDRHFQKEIKESLDYVYRYWNDKRIGNDGGSCTALNTIALALRILRLHKYDVSSGGSVEPKDFSFRIRFAKIASLATVIDDIYDTYGTLEELKLFTNAFERWDPSSVDCLPEYMKVVFIINDISTFKVEATRGEEASCVRCYMRDNPNSIEEAALDYLNSFQDELLKELMWEYLKKDSVPTCTKDHAVNLSRGIQLFYKKGDGFSVATKDIREHIWKILVQHIKI
ncbi:hypothetical protein SUGI_0536720 [Cryptomeria japonica]|nr:hypothetical protein SUGI_0536720 [Cryptomeria japonica]